MCENVSKTEHQLAVRWTNKAQRQPDSQSKKPSINPLSMETNTQLLSISRITKQKKGQLTQEKTDKSKQP